MDELLAFRRKRKKNGGHVSSFFPQPNNKENQERASSVLPLREEEAKFCSWREMAVSAEECVKPCYEFDPGKVKECRHLVTWWKGRLKWLEANNIGANRDKQPSQVIALSPEADCFDPDGALASLLECAERKGISDAQVASIVDDLIRAQSLKSPWGIKIKGSPALGDYWIVSDEEAKKLIPTHEVIFAQDDIRLLAEVREIFGIKSVEVKKYDTGKQAGI
ncbi:MAG: hypothetical protein A3G93_08455 [Nitrospinae bacterium RIFCSPLOWO2_12_FULL_45_22]|nr:MAG: hypothetical protein A3G93_08455 [Nitrospinae bacterium RIFCSPLOWO2_12_FULL_45_22]